MENNSLSTLNEEQQQFLKENIGKLNEQELMEKLSVLGPKLDMTAFGNCIKDMTARIRAEVFKQELSEEELEMAAGGGLDICSKVMRLALCGMNGGGGDLPADYQCRNCYSRDIYRDGFPNCSATVEDGSWCSSNDACFFSSTYYENMQECHKAWK